MSDESEWQVSYLDGYRLDELSDEKLDELFDEIEADVGVVVDNGKVALTIIQQERDRRANLKRAKEDARTWH